MATVHIAKAPEAIVQSQVEKGQVTRILVMSDLHMLHLDRPAYGVMTKFRRYLEGAEGIHGLIDLGDLVDMGSLSKHLDSGYNARSEPAVARKGENANKELTMAAKHAASLRKDHPHSWIVMLEGNHLWRLSTYVAERAQDLADCGLIKGWPERLGLPALNITWVPGRNPTLPLQLPGGRKFIFSHGLSTGENAARGELKRWGNASGISGHIHKRGYAAVRAENTGNGLDGEYAEWHSVGCLAQLNPGYMQGANWCQGVALVEIAHGRVTVEQIPIVTTTVGTRRTAAIVWRGQRFTYAATVVPEPTWAQHENGVWVPPGTVYNPTPASAPAPVPAPDLAPDFAP